VLACLALAPVARTAPPTPPTPSQHGEDLGNGNSAAENVSALSSLTTGLDNTAHGWFSLTSNTIGAFNTADGFQALNSNIDGGTNTAIGAQALFNNTSGGFNAAVGDGALFSNRVGNFCSAIGQWSLFTNTASGNTALGFAALYSNTTGLGNIAVGQSAGFFVSDANHVICIGSLGANVSSSTWINNIFGVTTQNATTAPVIVSADGQLGTVASSKRFKKDIATMEKASEAILSLRPVTFHYKTDTKGTPQFGLIAEEVAKINPALVLPDQEGKPYSVRYEAVNAMLLNEFLKEHRTVQEQEKKIEALQTEMKEQKALIQKVSAQLQVKKSAPQTVQNTR
jgi:hypothetical protein